MDYYTKRMKAHSFIKDIINEAKGDIKIIDICFMVDDRFGFGDSFTLKYLKALKSMDFIIIENDKILKR